MVTYLTLQIQLLTDAEEDENFKMITAERVS